jgi:hypothetical protein
MRDNSKLRGIRTRLGTGSANPAGRVGEPNVLTGAAVPNRLSSEVARPVNVSTLTQAPTVRRAGTVATRPGVAPADLQEAPRGRRAPALQTIIVIGFIVLTAIRLASQFLGDGSFGDQTETNPPNPAATADAPGPITFGTAMDDECALTGTATQFGENTEVWWTAELPTRQSSKAVVVVLVLRDHEEVARDVWPPEGTSSWTVMCDGPVAKREVGSYRVEVWDEDLKVLQAAGEYQIR